MAAAIFHGTEAEGLELHAAVRGKGCCADGGDCRPERICTACQLLFDQNALDHLLYARRLSGLWWRAEWRRGVEEMD